MTKTTFLSVFAGRLRTDINVSFCLQGRLEEIGAVATVERAMGVKRALNAHCTRGGRVDTSQMLTLGGNSKRKYQTNILAYHLVVAKVFFALDLWER